MSNFPLYDRLCADLPKKDLTVLQKKKVIIAMSEIDIETAELIYALILAYYNVNTQGDNLTIPYKGKLKGTGIEFNLLDFPLPLRQLLLKFVEIHQEKIKEDQKIEASKISDTCVMNSTSTISEEPED